MKTRPFGSVLLVLFLCVALTACGTETPNPTPQESEITTTTTTTASVTTTETTAMPSTTTTSAPSITYTYPTYTGPTYPPYTTLATSTGSLDATVTGSTTATTYYSPFTPVEDNSSTPDKDRQCLLFKVENEDVELTYEGTMRYPLYNNHLLWHYAGTTSKGVSITVSVEPEQNKIHEMAYGENSGCIDAEEKDVRACIKNFLEWHNIPLDAEDVSLTPTYAATEGANGPVFHSIWTFGLPMTIDGDYFTGRVSSENGKMYVSSITNKHAEQSETQPGSFREVPYCFGDDYDVMIPRWKRE